MTALRLLVLLAVAAWTAGAPVTAPAQTGSPQPSVFGSREVRATGLAPFRKWTRMLDRQSTEQVLYDTPCRPGLFANCRLPEWRALMAQLHERDPRSQAEAVNRFFNQQRYVVDGANFGLSDYWSTPLQFLQRDGDCEDYAIAKYVSLRQLGFAPSQLRVLVLDDVNLRTPHAVLLAYVGGQALVLDNQIGTVVASETIRHYRPIYSINEEAWWVHRP